MAEVSSEAISEIERALERYWQVVEASRLQSTTKKTYLVHAGNFVRWLKGEFQPGATL